MKYLKLFDSYWANKNGASGLLPICTKTKRICIGLRSAEVNEPFTWGNFGGAIGKAHDGSDVEVLNPEENAEKEFSEEVGYNGRIRMVKSFTFIDDDFVYYNYLGLVPEEFDLDPNAYDSWEINEIKWVELSELIEHEDLHFGLKSLLNNSLSQIEKYCK